MPAPPPESEPAMVTAIGVMTASAPRARRRPRRACSCAAAVGSRRERQRRDHRHAVGAGRNGRAGIGGIDAGDGAGGKFRIALAEHVDDAAQALDADRRLLLVLRRGRIDAADADIVERLDRRRFGQRLGVDREPDDRVPARAAAARPSGAMSVCPTCTPSAPAASATSTRSLISSGTPNGASAAFSARAVSTMTRVSLFLSRSCTSVAPPAASSFAKLGQGCGRPRARDRQWHRDEDRRALLHPDRCFSLQKLLLSLAKV